MSYRNDQFYKIEDVEGVGISELDGWGSGPSRRGAYYWRDANNPRFTYPDRTVRTYEKNDRGDIVPVETLLQRGFIRSLPTSTDDPIRKCQFQFNPQTLSQNVSASETMLNFFQQSPGQMAQPFAGNFNMSFSIMFDRSMEINNSSRPLGNADPYGTGIPGRPSSDGLGSSGPGPNWESGSPSQIGVLRDIGTLYTVIGQGFTDRTRDYVLNQIRTQITVAGSLNADEEDEVGEDVTKAIANAEEFIGLQANMGNYGFLTPLPVRVVFSSLYMLEGYVTGCDVSFVKFNTAYVPIQAVVGLTMRVLHAGFAKKDTFTTYSLEQAAKIQIEEENSTRLDSWRIFTDEFTDVQALLAYHSTNPTDVNPFTPEVLTAGGSFKYQAVVRITDSGKFSNIKQLFIRGNTSVSVSGSIKLYADMDSFEPVGSEDKEPVVNAVFTSGPITTLEEFNSYIHGKSFILRESPKSVSGSDPFGTFPTNGGKARWVIDVQARIVYEGFSQLGKSQSFSQGDDSADFWTSNINDTLKIEFPSYSTGTVPQPPNLDSTPAGSDTSGSVVSDVGSSSSSSSKGSIEASVDYGGNSYQ